MNKRRFTRSSLIMLFAVMILMLAACQPAVTPPPQATQPAAQPTAAPATAAPVTQATATSAPAQPTQPVSDAVGDISLDYAAVAQNMTLETVPAKAGGADSPYWEAGPEYRLVTLQGYPVTNHMHQPRIFIYPTAALATANEGAGKMAADLQALLQNQQVGDRLPFLPLFNAMQVFHSQVQFLEFKTGKGVRFLTQFDQAPLPVNNNELFYTFQGLTSDGKYYVAAILPVTQPDLPADSKVSEAQAAEMSDFQGYLTKTVTQLNQQPAESFTPDLTKLDALVRSLTVK